MSEKEEKILCLCTNGPNDLEMAAIPFVMANAALAMDVKAMIALQGDAVYFAKKGYVDSLPSPGGFEPISKLMKDFIELGGELRVCVPCIKIRNIPEADLIDGAKTTAAGALNVEALNAKAVYTY